MVLDSHIGFLVKVLHGDVKAVFALGGELVKSFEAEPQLTYSQIMKLNYQQVSGNWPRIYRIYLTSWKD